MSWLSWLMPGRQSAATGQDAATPIALSDRIEPVDEGPLADELKSETQSVLPWLLGCDALTDTPITPIERSALDAIAQTLAQPELTGNLLPRAAAVIPQMIALLRQTELPTTAIAERIGKDALLTAEVMRLASSPYYRVQGNVTNLEQAIELIGLQGLQTVIARVVLKPIYQAVPGPLSGRAGSRIWDYSEALARHTAIRWPICVRRLCGRHAAQHRLDARIQHHRPRWPAVAAASLASLRRRARRAGAPPVRPGGTTLGHHNRLHRAGAGRTA